MSLRLVEIERLWIILNIGNSGLLLHIDDIWIAYRWYLNCISMISELRLTMMMTCACWYCICTELRKAVNTFVLIYYHKMPFIGQTGIFYTNLLSHFLPEISSCLKNKFFFTFRRSEATLAPFVRAPPYENKAFLTNSVIPWPNGKFFNHEKRFLAYLIYIWEYTEFPPIDFLQVYAGKVYLFRLLIKYHFSWQMG